VTKFEVRNLKSEFGNLAREQCGRLGRVLFGLEISDFGFRQSADDEMHAEAPLVLNPAIERPLKGLQVLFARPINFLCLNPSLLTKALRAYHPWLLHARCKMDCTNPDAPFGLAGWDDHVIKVVGFSLPLPMDVTTRCVRPAHYAPEFKRQALAHRAHVQLYYAGFASSPLEQYVALAAVAGALASGGGVAVLNENARTSLPGEVVAARDWIGDRLELLRTLPIPTLYAGFVKYEVASTPGVWMRTHGCGLLGLPDLAFLAAGHHHGERVFDLFASVLNHLLTARETLGDGHTLQLGNEWFLRARYPNGRETYLENESELFVLQTIEPSTIGQ
jgi:hypothetical protein